MLSALLVVDAKNHGVLVVLTGGGVTAENVVEFHQLRELAPAFGVCTLRQSIERAAKER